VNAAANVESAPAAFSPTLAGRRAARLAWEARQVDDRTAGLVCVMDQEEPVEDRRTKEVVASQRVRVYAYKDKLKVDAAVRYDNEPLRWFGPEAHGPVQQPRRVGFLRRWSGNRPADRSA